MALPIHSDYANWQAPAVHANCAQAKTRVAILGAGPAGVGAAWLLTKRGHTSVSVFEQRPAVGGNAGSFNLNGIAVDYGSHRLHPACEPKILSDLQQLMQGELLDRPRHGRILLRGRWIHFPLKPLDLLSNLPPSFSAGVGLDTVRKLISPKENRKETFASVLEKGLGRTICREFYFPYAQKIWGLSAEELSPIQARRRVSAGSLKKMVGKVLKMVPGIKTKGTGRFFYPRGGYGEISRALANAATTNGAEIQLGTSVTGIELGNPHTICVESNGKTTQYEAEHIWSTLPISLLAQIVNPEPPCDVLAASHALEFRSMILVYLVLQQQQFTPFDAHYFPETDIPMSRLSEPKNYSASSEPQGRTVLCAELPCSYDDPYWRDSDENLGQLVQDALNSCGLPVNAKVTQVTTRRLRFAYPIYRVGYEEYFDKLDQWASGLPRVLTLGRQGLFAHDNTHHTLSMAYAAVDCLSETGDFDRDRWQDYRSDFTRHVVED